MVHSRVEEGVVCRSVAPVDLADRIHVESTMLGAGRKDTGIKRAGDPATGHKEGDSI